MSHLLGAAEGSRELAGSFTDLGTSGRQGLVLGQLGSRRHRLASSFSALMLETIRSKKIVPT